MAKLSKGYSAEMFRTLKRLRKIGLPENLFDADFEEKEEANRKAHADLLERLRKLENSEEWSGVDLPWKAAREDFEKRVAEGEEVGFVATQPIHPVWERTFELNFMDWHNRWVDQKARERRKLERESKKKKPD